MSEQKITPKEAMTQACKDYADWMEDRINRPDTPEYRRITELEDEISRLRKLNSNMSSVLESARNALG